MGRVLSPGGIAVFQLPVVPETIYGALRQLIRRGINLGVRGAVQLARLNPGRLRINSPAYRGVRLSARDIRHTCRSAGLELAYVTDTRRSWRECYQTFVRCRKYGASPETRES
jgi:hypothetical protein